MQVGDQQGGTVGIPERHVVGAATIGPRDTPQADCLLGAAIHDTHVTTAGCKKIDIDIVVLRIRQSAVQTANLTQRTTRCRTRRITFSQCTREYLVHIAGTGRSGRDVCIRAIRRKTTQGSQAAARRCQVFHVRAVPDVD